MITPTLENIIHNIFSNAKSIRHEFVTIEHLLLGLLEEESAKNTLLSCGSNIQSLHDQLTVFIKNNVPVAPQEIVDLHTQPTLGFQRVLQRAIMHTQSAGKTHVTGLDILVAIFSEKDSHAVYFLQQQNISRLDIVNAISHGTNSIKSQDSNAGSSNGSGNNNGKYASGNNAGGIGSSSNSANNASSNINTASTNPEDIEGFIINLNEQVKVGKVDPLIGRHSEVARVVEILCRRRKNNPILVGEAGVGKTAIAEGLAYQIVHKNVPAVLQDTIVYAVDMCNLLAGTRYRGDFEQRIKNLITKIKSMPNAILFVDEIHTLIGAGASSGSSVDAGNLLKPVLSSGELRCLGATTFDEYRKHFEKEAALARRFQKVDVLEPSIADTIEILTGSKNRLENHHRVKYSNEAIELAVTLSVKHINDRFLPDKAIDVLDEAGAAQQILQKEDELNNIDRPIAVIGRKEIETIIAKIARVPLQSISIDDRQKLKNLDKDLKAVIFGQDSAINILTSNIKMSKAGLGNPDKPIGSFLFAGPTGVGKTEVAKQLADKMGIPFIRFDMSEYMERHAVSRLIGSPPGYVGYEEGGLLTESINKNPHCVLLLDEIEKAHPDIFNLLLQVMDHGVLTDNNGRKAHFKNIVLIMTSNIGAQDMQKNTIGFTTSKDTSDNPELKRMFTPEFRNRLSSIVQFSALSEGIIIQVVNKFLHNLELKLAEKKVQIHFTKAIKQYLAKTGFDPLMGARPMERLIQNEISKALSEELLFGKLVKGGEVTIDRVDESIKLIFKAKKINKTKPKDKPKTKDDNHHQNKKELVLV
jgi:ATP-dependent Clp protease ATP-binding subunit ClpA